MHRPLHLTTVNQIKNEIQKEHLSYTIQMPLPVARMSHPQRVYTQLNGTIYTVSYIQEKVTVGPS